MKRHYVMKTAHGHAIAIEPARKQPAATAVSAVGLHGFSSAD